MGGKKWQKWRPHHVTITASSGDDDEEAGDSGEEFVAIVERDFKWQTRSPEDHFKKLLEVTYQYHSYPVKNKLEDCAKLKKFITSGAFSRGSKPGGDLGGKGAAPIPGETEVMTILS
jgi:hypothetical protein